jgi:hypothetical protein
MKAKISKVGPVGDITETKEFYIPFVKKNIIQLIKLKDGTKIKGEPMKQDRHLLEIGEFKYWLLQTGELILIDERMC